MADHILIIDFGSQLTQLIARRVRESGVYSEIYPCNKISKQTILNYNPKGIILSGGPASVTQNNTPRVPDEIFDMGLPILGICYGQQTMVERLGGVVKKSDEKEFGRSTLNITDNCAIFDGIWEIGDEAQVWMSHGDRVETLPDGFKIVGTSENAPNAVIANDKKNMYGVQFHPEVVHTPQGTALLKNFTHRIAGCLGNWTMRAFKQQGINKIRAQVGDANA